MKKLFFSIMLLACSTAIMARTMLAESNDNIDDVMANSKPYKGKATVDVSLNGWEGEWLKVAVPGVEMDSVQIKDGKVSYSFELTAPMSNITFIKGDPNDHFNVKYFGAFVDAQNTIITVDVNNPQMPKVEGSQTQQDYEEVMAIRDLSKQVEWIKAHPKSYGGLNIMRFLVGQMDYADIQAVYGVWNDDMRQTDIGKEVKAELDILARVQPGQPAPLFRAKSNKGKEIGIEDLRGKVVLLDFWASWCVPCRKSNPHVKELYQKYHSKGFECFYVADDDNAPEKWHAAIAKDELQQFYHVLRGLKWDKNKGVEGMDKSNDISSKYAIHYLPTKYLIDRDGNIIGKFNDEQLDEQLKEIFGY